MKKLIIGAVLLVVAGAAAAPFVIGGRIESLLQDEAKKSNERLQTIIKTNPYVQEAEFSLVSYQKNYLNSTAKSLLHLAVNIPGLTEGVTSIDIPVISHIDHGPYLKGAGFGMAKASSRLDVAGMNLPEVITADTFVLEDVAGFSGDLKETLNIAPIKYTDENGLMIDYAGSTQSINGTFANRLTFDGAGEFGQLQVSNADQSGKALVLNPFKFNIQAKGNAEMTQGEYQFNTDPIKLEADGGGATIQSITVAGTYQPSSVEDLSLGSSELKLSNLEVSNPAALPVPVKLPEFMVRSVVEQDEQKNMNISAEYSAKFSPDLMTLMGSPVDVDTANIRMQFKSLPVEVIQQFQEAMQKLAALRVEASEEERQEVTALMEENASNWLKMLVDNSSALQLSVKATSADGNLDADIDTRFKPGEPISKEQLMEVFQGQDPAAALALLEGTGHVELAKAVTDKAGLTETVTMMGGPFVKLDGETFKSALSIKDGQILVNDIPVPLPSAGDAAALEGIDIDSPDQGDMTGDEAAVEGEDMGGGETPADTAQ